MRTYWSETLQRHVTIPDDTEEPTMTHSPESASTPISMGGWKYNPADPQDRIDFEHFGSDELESLERDRNYDFTDHPTRQSTTEGVILMGTTITATDIRTQVEHALAEHATTHYVDRIVRDIIERYGLVSIESIEHDEFWSLVADHAGPSPFEPVPADHGTLTDYVTGESIRPATAGEHAQSLAAGETGAFELDGRAVFVAGGPETLA